jgi:hypothetical protein
VAALERRSFGRVMAEIRAGVRRRLFVAVVVVLLGQMAFAMVTSALAQTPTYDEPVYVGTAVVYYEQHSLRYNAEHPPLGKLIIGAGVMAARPRLDSGFAGDQWALGQKVLYGSGNDPWRLMFLARLPVILLTLLFGLVVLAFARDLAGPVAGLVALALYAFSPDLITHGSLATLDVPAAGFLVTALWLVWRARRRARLYLPLAGLALGAALATRMSTLPAAPIVLALAGVAIWGGSGRSARFRRLVRCLGAVGGVAGIAVGVVWASYLAVDPALAWSTPAEAVAVHGFRAVLVGLLPFPAAYRDGLRIQFGLENVSWGGFLFGHRYAGSRWYYLPVALLVKTPLGSLALWAAGAVTLARRRLSAVAHLLLPGLVLLAVAMTGTRDFGVRYVIVLPMLLAVTAGTVVTLRRRWARVVTAVLVAAVAVSSVRTFPYYLPYSNEAFGGTARTHLLLHDSNSDWGQDLGRLAGRLRADYPGQAVWLVYQGGGDPAYYGLDSRDPLGVPAASVRGLLVVSDDAIDMADAQLRGLIASSTAVGEVGHSITIFRR